MAVTFGLPIAGSVGADLSWIERKALRLKNIHYRFFIIFKGNMDESNNKTHQKLSRVFIPSEPTVISLQN